MKIMDKSRHDNRRATAITIPVFISVWVTFRVHFASIYTTFNTQHTYNAILVGVSVLLCTNTQQNRRLQIMFQLQSHPININK